MKIAPLGVHLLALLALLMPVRGLLAGSGPPGLPIVTLAGDHKTLQDYSGKVVLMSFWLVDCKPCRAEMPHLDALSKAHRAEGLEVIAVNLDEPRRTSEIKPTLKRYGYTFDVALDPEGETAAPFNPSRATPFVVLLDRSGKIRYEHMGYKAGDELPLKKIVEEVLKELPTSQ